MKIARCVLQKHHVGDLNQPSLVAVFLFLFVFFVLKAGISRHTVLFRGSGIRGMCE